MGVGKSRLCVLVIGATNTGKTDFLERVAYGNTSSGKPTFGTYSVDVVYNRKRITLLEVGGTLKKKIWAMFVGKPDYDGIYFFIDRHATKETLYSQKNDLFLACIQQPELPVCIVHRWEKGKPVTITFDQVDKILQLEQLGTQRHVLSIQMASYGTQSAQNAERLFHWTVINC